MSQCTNCGSELQPQARFCSVCSYPVGKADAKSPVPQDTPAWPQPPASSGDTPAWGEPAAAPAATHGAASTPPLQPNFGTGAGPSPQTPPTYQAAQAFPAGPSGPPKTDGQAIAALVCGIAGLVVCPLILSIVAIVLGRMSKARIRQSQGALEGESMANAGFILGIAGLVIGILIIAFAIPAFLNLPASSPSPTFP